MLNMIERLNFALDKCQAPPLNKGRQQYLAHLVGTSERSVRRWYAGGEIPASKLAKLAQFFELNLHWFKTGEGCSRPVPPSIQLQPNEAIIPILPWDAIAAWLSQHYKIAFDHGNYYKICLDHMSEASFILKIVLPDLQPYIAPNSWVFIDPAEHAAHEDFVLVSKYDGIKPIIRRYLHDHHNILLEAPYPNIPTTKLTDLDRILGVVKQHLTPHKASAK